MQPVLGIFSHAFLLNVESRPSRLAYARKELGKVGIDPEVFYALPAIDRFGDRSAGGWSNKISTLAILMEAKARGLDSFLLVEDDIVFHPRFPEGMDAARARLNASTSWHQFTPYDWYNRSGIVPERIEIARVGAYACKHFWAIHSRAYDAYIDIFERSISLRDGMSSDATTPAHANLVMLATTANLVGQNLNFVSDTQSPWGPGAPVRWCAPSNWK